MDMAHKRIILVLIPHWTLQTGSLWVYLDTIIEKGNWLFTYEKSDGNKKTQPKITKILHRQFKNAQTRKGYRQSRICL